MMFSKLGKAERREAEVAKLQRAVVNKEGQVGLPDSDKILLLGKIFGC